MNDSPENQDFEVPSPDRIDLTEPIAWNAPEGMQVKRGKMWYVFFVIVLIGLMALAILVFKNWTFAVLLPIMTVALFVLSNKTPQVINYAISPKGIYIADVLHDFSEFRAFGLIHENNQHSILLLPVRREKEQYVVIKQERKTFKKLFSFLALVLSRGQFLLNVLE